jgi:UDP-glucose 4-epimerase
MYERIYGLDVTICRFYNVYGDYMPESGSYRTVLPIFLEQYKNGESLTITGQGDQRRDFTHVDDIIGAMMRIVQLNKWGSTFELGRGKNYSIKELVLMISKFTNGKASWTHTPEIRGEMKETLCRSDLARKKLRWEPKINLNEWLEEKLCK